MVNFLKYRWLYFAISAIVILSGIFSIVRYGYIYSIDFVGGSNIEYQLNKNVNAADVRTILKNNGVDAITVSVTKNVITARAKAIDEKKEAALKAAISKKFNSPVTVLRSETVGPSLGRETMIKTALASLLAVVGILIYMSFAFKGINFAIAAILALFHDLFVVIGVYSILSYFYKAEVDTMFVTAVLTTMSFSVHDTIVIFDKIREYMKTEGRGDIDHYVNRALTETLVRSLNNSMTIIFMLLALTLLGGSTIRFFVLTLLIGTITGTYSSPFVAAPLLVWLEKMRKRK